MTSMHLSTRLGLIASRYLAQAYYEDRWVTAPEIATYYRMNVRSLMKALSGLSKKGLLYSQVGGLNPGFIFSRSPEEITVLDIMSALEEKYSSPCCKDIIPGLKCDCQSSSKCMLRGLFDTMIDDIHVKLNGVTVAEYSNIKSTNINKLK